MPSQAQPCIALNRKEIRAEHESELPLQNGKVGIAYVGSNGAMKGVTGTLSYSILKLDGTVKVC